MDSMYIREHVVAGDREVGRRGVHERRHCAEVVGRQRIDRERRGVRVDLNSVVRSPGGRLGTQRTQARKNTSCIPDCVFQNASPSFITTRNG